MTKLSSRLSILYSEYPGDDAWNKYVSSFPEVDKALVNQILIEADFIRVLYWKKGNNQERLENWLSQPVPALDDKTPFEVLKLLDGETIFRSVIMRMP